jgi:hypothetical protein
MTSHPRVLAAAGLLICLLIAFARPILTGGVISTTDTLSYEYPWRGVTKLPVKLERFALCDVTTSWHPWKIFYHREFQRGHYPFWSQDVACGYPIFAHSTLMGYSLPIFLQCFLPGNKAINLGFYLQIWIGLAGMMWLLRSWRLSPASCFLGSIAFGLSYPMVEWLPAVSVTGAIVSLPYLILALDKFRESGEIRFLGWASIACAIGIFQGSIQSMVYLFLAVLAFAFADGRRGVPVSISCRKWVPVLALFTILSLSLAAIGLVPALEFFLFHNARPRALVDNWPAFLILRPLVLTPLTVIGTIYPGLLGNGQSIDFKSIVNAIFGNMGFGGYWGSSQWSAYVGIAPLALACVAWKQRETDARVRLALWLIGLPLGLMLLSPLYTITYMRGLGVTAFGLSIMSAVGLDSLSSPGKIHQRLQYGVMIFALILFVGMGAVTLESDKLTAIALKVMSRQEASGHTAVYLAADHSFQISKVYAFIANYTLASPALRLAVFFCLVTAFLFHARDNKWISIQMAQTCLVLLTLADLAALSWRTLPVVPVNTVYPPIPALNFLQRQPGFFRVDSAWKTGKEIETARSNQLLPYDLNVLGISESVVPEQPKRANGDLFPAEYCNVRYLILPPHSTVEIDPQRLVSIYQEPDAEIYRYKHALPRAFLFPLRKGETPTQGRQRLEQLSPEDILGQNPGPVDVIYEDSEHVRLSFNASAPALLVFLDRMYPGWGLLVKGLPRRLEPVFGVMRSFEVRAGESQAQLTFAPVSWHAGALLTISAGIFTVALLTLKRRKKAAV